MRISRCSTRCSRQADARRAGRTTIDLALGGTLTGPQATGTVRLGNGSVQDYVQGTHITDLNGLIQADGNSLRIAQLAGRAGSGTLSIAGTIGVLQPNLPVSLTVTAHDAQLLASDLLNATANVDPGVCMANSPGNLAAVGEIRVAKANIKIPDSLPQSVAVLNVRRAGEEAAPAVGAWPIDRAGAHHRRAGAGVCARSRPRCRDGRETEDRRHRRGADDRRRVRAAARHVQPGRADGLISRRGKSRSAGWAWPESSIRPWTSSPRAPPSALTATLTVTSYADAPKLQLSSTPDLPQDEILGQLLFGQSTQQLSPFQLAAIAQAATSFGGVGGGDPLAAVRGGLGLDPALGQRHVRQPQRHRRGGQIRRQRRLCRRQARHLQADIRRKYRST